MKYFAYAVIACIIGIVTVKFVLFNHPTPSQPPQPAVIVSTGTFSSGDTLYSVLKNHNVAETEAHAVVNALTQHVEPRSFKQGQPYELKYSTQNALIGFTYFPSEIEKYDVEKNPLGLYTVTHEKEPLYKTIVGANGTITSSLYEAIVNTNIGTPGLAMDFTDIFAWQIDFLTDTHEGDTFVIIWEKYTSKRGYTYNGNILTAAYSSRGVTHTAFRFKDNYYDAQGKSMRKAFLRSPLNYRRISSYFSYRRFHPVLKYFRPHLGIDYSAGAGTPIVSIGNGSVSYAGWSGGFGKLVKIRHSGGYETWYGHLSRFGKGIHGGAKIQQGQVIGYVGATGLATGPHLDFRVKSSGRFVNFLRLKFPPAASVSQSDMPAFCAVRDEKLKQLQTLMQQSK